MIIPQEKWQTPQASTNFLFYGGKAILHKTDSFKMRLEIHP